eukprot:4704063-Pyramimonas_sp.AAC.1
MRAITHSVQNSVRLVEHWNTTCRPSARPRAYHASAYLSPGRLLPIAWTRACREEDRSRCHLNE